MRPNLMSPRRVSASGEDSILAMLEREPARKRKEGTSGAKLAWYGASALAVMTLTGTLVWMAANNDGMRPELHEPVLAAAAPMPTAGATIVQVAMAPAAAAPQAQPRTSAVIVEQPPAEAVPPLRLLKPAPEKPAPAARVHLPAPVAAPAPVPARPVARSTPPRPVAAVAAKPKPAMAAKNAARAGQPKGQRSGNPAKGADAGVDADVALISAVIVHANGHAPADSQMTELLCPNDNCQARPPRQ